MKTRRGRGHGAGIPGKDRLITLAVRAATRVIRLTPDIGRHRDDAASFHLRRDTTARRRRGQRHSTDTLLVTLQYLAGQVRVEIQRLAKTATPLDQSLPALVLHTRRVDRRVEPLDEKKLDPPTGSRG